MPYLETGYSIRRRQTFGQLLQGDSHADRKHSVFNREYLTRAAGTDGNDRQTLTPIVDDSQLATATLPEMANDLFRT
jgi:hypothetical protein